MNIAGKEPGPGKECFVIAEAGVNHNGDLNLAKELVDAAAYSGADAVKFQTYKTEEIVTKQAPQAEYQKKNTGKSESQYDMLKRVELNEEDFKELKEYCDSKGIIFMSTPHTPSAVDVLEPLVPAYKIGSGDLNNTPFLIEAAKKGKPMIISTGMATLEEVRNAVTAIEAYNKEVAVLHCTTSYPCPHDQVNLAAMQTIKEATGCVIGYSDHTEGIDISLMAVARGAYVLEKHFTTDRNLPGPDHNASLEPEELKEMIDKIRKEDYPEVTEEVLGRPDKRPTDNEREIATATRKSIIAKKNLPRGHTITYEDVIIKRPGTGIPPSELENIIGKKTKEDIEEEALLSYEQLE